MGIPHPQQGTSQPQSNGQAAWKNAPEVSVAVAAYYIWEKEGRPAGRSLDHWLRAEGEARRIVNAESVRGPVR